MNEKYIKNSKCWKCEKNRQCWKYPASQEDMWKKPWHSPWSIMQLPSSFTPTSITSVTPIPWNIKLVVLFLNQPGFWPICNFPVACTYQHPEFIRLNHPNSAFYPILLSILFKQSWVALATLFVPLECRSHLPEKIPMVQISGSLFPAPTPQPKFHQS